MGDHRNGPQGLRHRPSLSADRGSRGERYESGHLFVYQDRRAWSDIVEFLASPE